MRCRHLALSALLLVFPVLGACGGEPEASTPTPEAASGEPAVPAAPENVHPLLGKADELVYDAKGEIASSISEGVRDSLFHMRVALQEVGRAQPLVVDYPHEGSLFPPEFVAPTFLWHDPVETADTWLVYVRFPVHQNTELEILVPGPPPPQGAVDPDAFGETNAPYEPTPYQASARSWTPSDTVWKAIKQRGTDAPAEMLIVGFSSTNPDTPLSMGMLNIQTSADPVGAPIFYRDVPLMPDVGETGVIQPLGRNALPLIGWRLKDVSRSDSRLLLTGMFSCANCHSFTRDGKTLAMDVDGPAGDKGAYAIAPIQKTTTVTADRLITWNSFADKPEGHKTIGFLSRISPDGRYVVSTVNEALYVANFTDYRFLQVFFPTRGILAFYSTETGEMHALPGADSKAYVHCDAVWTPDGKELVFARAKAMDPYDPSKPIAKYPNDPNEPQIQYDLYRMPFNEGRGGPRTPIAGASENGMSNTFPKVTPDGKWVVFVKCRNGQLLRPDGKLWIVPLEGGEAREMRCNTDRMNSWHSFSPNGRWMVFSSKTNTPYTQMFLTHLDENGNDTPPILVPNATTANRAVNLPEFLNAPYDALTEIEIPAAHHYVHFQRGETLLKEGRLPEARALFEKALQEEPTFSRAHASLGVVLQGQGDREGARKHYEQALEYDPRNWRVLNNLGLLVFYAGEIDHAAELWQRALKINPFDAKLHNNLGMAYAARSRLEEGSVEFRKALELDPKLGVAHTNLGVLERKRGRYAEAVQHFEAALGLDARDVQSLEELADTYVERGDAARAKDALERLLSLSPDDPGAQSRMAWVLATAPDERLRDGPRAVALARSAVERTGARDARALDALGAALAETGEFRAAAEAASLASALIDPSDRTRMDGVRERKRLYESSRPYRDRR